MTEQQIRVKENGPYVVSGAVPLVGKQPIHTEHGEPIAWTTPEALDDGVAYALCRCGGSASKPMCDGSDAANGFDGTESAPTDSYGDRGTDLGGSDQLTVRDDRGICVHAGFCGNRVSNVWKMVHDADDTQVRAQVAAMVERCPSGALTYELAESGPIEPDLPAEVAVIPDGPLWVSGGIPVERADGQPFETRNRVTLCRCGQSSAKPLCDGSHKEAGFVG